MTATATIAAPRIAETSAEWEVHSSLELIDELYSYNHWIFNSIRPFIRGSVFEVGCGTGNISQFLLNQERVVGIEPFPHSLRIAQKRFAPHLNVHLHGLYLDDCPNELVPRESFDTSICLNVLEHIEDDVAALRRMRELCRVDGRVVILVPALMTLYGELDRSYAHCRRYNRRTLSAAFNQAGLKVTKSFYMNALGCFGWFWCGRVLRRRQIPVSAARTFNKLVPFVDALERIFPPPFGQSLVMVGEKA
jgi:SAM-dependent methyltransferase